MKTKLLLLVLPLLLTSCVSGGAIKGIMAQMAKDPASAHIKISSVYAVVEISRANPQTNTLSHTIAPDGTITVTRKQP